MSAAFDRDDFAERRCCISNTSPIMTMDDFRNHVLRDAEFSRKLWLIGCTAAVFLANCFHVVCGQFGIAVFCALMIGRPMATFGNHVGGVVGSGSEKQMVDVDAQSVVAFVADHQRWQFAMRKHPSDAVSALLTPVYIDAAITLLSTASPLNAPISQNRGQPRQKTLLNRKRWRRWPAFQGTEFGSSFSNNTCLCEERLTACLTRPLNAGQFARVSSRHLCLHERWMVFRAGPQLVAAGSPVLLRHHIIAEGIAMDETFPQEFAKRCCAKCFQTDDLCPLGNRDLCPKHFHEAIADLDLKEQDKQENSGAWEE